MNRGATIVLAPNRMAQGRILRSAGRRIASLRNRLHHGEDCLGRARAEPGPAASESGVVSPITAIQAALHWLSVGGLPRPRTVS